MIVKGSNLDYNNFNQKYLQRKKLFKCKIKKI